VSELGTEFEKVKEEKVVPARYLKSQQKQAKLAAETAAAGGDGEGEFVASDKWGDIGVAMMQTDVSDSELIEVMILRLQAFFGS
jgi:hypothetical protein